MTEVAFGVASAMLMEGPACRDFIIATCSATQSWADIVRKRGEPECPMHYELEMIFNMQAIHEYCMYARNRPILIGYIIEVADKRPVGRHVYFMYAMPSFLCGIATGYLRLKQQTHPITRLCMGWITFVRTVVHVIWAQTHDAVDVYGSVWDLGYHQWIGTWVVLVINGKMIHAISTPM